MELFIWMCNTKVVIPCTFLRYVTLKEHMLNTADAEGQPFPLSIQVWPCSVVGAVIVTVDRGPAAPSTDSTKNSLPSPPLHEFGKCSGSQIISLYSDGRREKGYSPWCILSVVTGNPRPTWTLKEVAHDSCSFMMVLILFVFFPSRSWILSHQGLSLFSWEMRYEETEAQALWNQVWPQAVLATLAESQSLQEFFSPTCFSLYPA